MSKDRIPFFRFYPTDFIGGVRGLSAQEVGVYTMLLCRIYEENGPVEYHLLRLATYCGMRVPTFEKTVQKLADLGKVTIIDGLLSNPRAELEIANRANDLKNNSKAGKASAEKRLEKQRLDATTVERPFNHTDTDTDTDTEKKEDTTPTPVTVPRDGGGDGFQTDRELILAAIGVDPVSGLTGRGGSMLGTAADMAEVALWLDLPHLTIPTITDEIHRIMGGKRDGPPKSFRYFTEAMRRLSGALDQAPLSPIAPPQLQARGPTNDRIAFDHAIRHLADRLDQGTAHIEHRSRDPFAQLAGGDADAGQHRVVPLLRP